MAKKKSAGCEYAVIMYMTKIMNIMYATLI